MCFVYQRTYRYSACLHLIPTGEYYEQSCHVCEQNIPGCPVEHLLFLVSVPGMCYFCEQYTVQAALRTPFYVPAFSGDLMVGVAVAPLLTIDRRQRVEAWVRSQAGHSAAFRAGWHSSN